VTINCACCENDFCAGTDILNYRLFHTSSGPSVESAFQRRYQKRPNPR